ncbi:hypothetical protein H6758_00425 [Candidatus Nomurabacteria bacterium]|nr:hypothetical protein [Candidatus Nomurabacteria bacterium]
MSNTPCFDREIDKYFETHLPGQYTSSESGDTFEISEAEYHLHKMLKVPLPEVAPHERIMGLRAYMGGIELFSRILVGNQSVVTMYDPESEISLISEEDWFGDNFDAQKYAAEYSTRRSIISQIRDLMYRVPHVPLLQDPSSEKSQWSIYELAFKNSYATYGGLECEEVMYADLCIQSEHCVDVMSVVQTQWSYEGVQLFQCSNTFFSQFSSGLFDAYFTFGSINCSHVFGCVNIQNKEYCFFNQQLTKDEYESIVSKIDLSDRSVVEYWDRKAKEFWKQGYHLGDTNFQSENVIGQHLISSKDASGFEATDLERVYNVFDVGFAKDCFDVTTSSNVEKSCLTACVTEGFENKMSLSCDNCINVEYCELCSNCENCFGCVGLRRKKFCIFNKQYTEEEYWKTLDAIKTQMLAEGTYGKFFRLQDSPIAYNISHAGIFFPKTKSQMESAGLRYYQGKPPASSNQTLEKVPERLSDFREEMLDKKFIDAGSGRVFQIVKPEFEFHKKFGIALPSDHSIERRLRRYKDVMEIRTSRGACEKCSAVLYTRTPHEQVRFLCGECYHGFLMSDKAMEFQVINQE